MVRISTVLNVLTWGIALLGYAPLSPYLEAVPRLLLPAALIGGLLADRAGYRLRGALPTVVSILFFSYYGVQFRGDNVVGPAVNLLAVLLAVRLVSEKNVRHYLQIYALSLFSLAGSSLFTLHASFLFYLVSLLVLIAAALVILTFHASDETLAVSRRGLKTVLSVALLMPAAAIPLMFIFFLILPRTQYPLWNFLNVGGSQVGGFSEKVQPGAASSVGELKTAAFRVSCAKLAKEQLYWRGIVLNSFAGNAWVRGNLPADEAGFPAAAGSVRQTVYPEPGKSGYLFALNVPRSISGIRASLAPDLVVKVGGAGSNRVKYEAVSVLSGIVRTRKEIDREFYLQLPRPVSPRLLAVGREIGARGRSDAEKVELLKDFYQSGKIAYATSDLPVSSDPLDEFLFRKKRGNCEFFASSFAILLRTAGVPSRLVGGYYGGEYNEVGGYYLITEDLAHVWVEIYLSGKGWVMFDPSTLSTNFQRVKDGSHADLAIRLKMYLDAASYYWNMAVINYDLEKQLQIVNRAGNQLKRASFAFHPGKIVLWGGLLLVFPAAVILLIRGRNTTREERILKEFLRLLQRKYPAEVTPATGLLELAKRTNEPLAGKFAAIYGEAVYRDRKLTGEECRALHEVLREIRLLHRKGQYPERDTASAEGPEGSLKS
jgi:protein-glutamine gamma-glutamyltransferase